MTTKEFSQSDALREELAGLVRTPAFIKATEAILLDGIPAPDNLGLPSPDVGNGRIQQLAGMKFMVERLQRLAMGQPEPAVVTTPRLYTEEDREELLKRTQEE